MNKKKKFNKLFPVLYKSKNGHRQHDKYSYIQFQHYN